MHFAQAQTTLYGYVKDADSGEALMGVSIIDLSRQQAAQTNLYGYYALKLDTAVARIRVSYVGYAPIDTLLRLSANDLRWDIALRPHAALPTVEVVANENRPEDQIGTVRLSMEQLKKVPMLLGEVDVLKGLSLTPGVSTGTEGTSGLLVRGGSPDQNLILLDGATVYNTAHLFGFLSVFNPGAISNVSLLKGGFPAQYGGRLSSIVEVSMKEGNKYKRHSELSLGTLNSWFMTEGYIKKGRSSYMLSGRNSWLTLLTYPSRLLYKKGAADSYFNYGMYDLNGKVNFQIGEKGKLFVSGFLGNDYLKSSVKENALENQYQLGWGNAQGNLRYVHTLSPTVFASFYTNINYFKNNIANEVKDGLDTNNSSRVQNNSNILDYTSRLQVDVLRWAKHSVKVGVESNYVTFRPSNISRFYNGAPVSSISNKTPIYTLAGFAQDDIKVGQHAVLHGGVRVPTYWLGQYRRTLIEPRAAFTLKDARQALKVGYAFMSQPLHLLSINGAGLPTDLWLPATARTPVQTAHHYSVGYSRNLWQKQLSLTVEGYYKSLQGLIDYKNTGFNFFDEKKQWEDNIERGGIGRAYGAELLLQKSVGKWNGWLGYTLSWSYRKFDAINNNMWYPARFDRRHDLEITGNYTFNDTWSMAANFIFTTGAAITLPQAIQSNLLDDRYSFSYQKRNQYRLPAYHRLDVSATKSWETRRDRQASLVFGVYNIYGRRNPFYLNTNAYPLIDPATGGIKGFQPSITGYTVFTLIPYINYSLKF